MADDEDDAEVEDLDINVKEMMENAPDPSEL